MRFHLQAAGLRWLVTAVCRCERLADFTNFNWSQSKDKANETFISWSLQMQLKSVSNLYKNRLYI